MTTEQTFQEAKKIACKPTVALNRDMVTVRHAMSLNITSTKPASIKHGVISVPINIFQFSDHKSIDRVVRINRDTMEVIRVD